jgi:hypothetical protein
MADNGPLDGPTPDNGPPEGPTPGNGPPNGPARRKSRSVTSRVRRVTEFVAGSVVLTIIVGIAGNWAYNHWFASGQTLRNEQAVEQAKSAADQETVAAKSSVEPHRNEGGPWVSPEAIDIPIKPNISGLQNHSGYPGDGRAFLAAAPDGVNAQATRADSYLKFTLTGTHNTPARIVSMTAVIDERQEPPTGTVFFAVRQGTTANDQLGFDFESNDLNARAFENGKLTADRYLDLHTVTLAKGESVGYFINTFAPIFGINIKYHIEVTFDSGPPLEIYDDGGKPFQIVSYPRTAQRGYTYGETGVNTLGLYPCSWPTQCMNNAQQPWPFH